MGKRLTGGEDWMAMNIVNHWNVGSWVQNKLEDKSVLEVTEEDKGGSEMWLELMYVI